MLERTAVGGQALEDSGLYESDLQTSVFMDFESCRSHLLDEREYIQLGAFLGGS